MRRGSALVAAAVVVMASATAAMAAPMPKVDVCHLDADSGMFSLISVSQNALDAHMRHGDGLPGGDVPGMAGYGFDESCVPTAYVTFCDVDLGYPFVETFGHASDNRIFYQGILTLGWPDDVEDSVTPGSGYGQYRTDAAGIANITLHAQQHGLDVLPGFSCFVTQSRAYGGL